MDISEFKSKKMKEIIIIIPFFKDGGVERLSANIVNYININTNIPISIYSMGRVSTHSQSFFDNNDSKTEIFISFSLLLKKLINCDCIVYSALTRANLFVVLLSFFFKFELITSVQCSIFTQEMSRIKRFFLPAVYHLIHNRSKIIHAITMGVKNDVEYLIGKSEKIVCIPNPTIDTDNVSNEIKKHLFPQKGIIRFVSLGRLHPQKGFDITISAFGELIKRGYTNFQYVIIGEGEERDNLEKLIDKSNLKEYVTLLGFISDYKEIYHQNDYFLFPSRYEGMGLALVEAVSSGIPVIASNCNYGPSEILDNGKFGSLIMKNFTDSSIWVKELETILSSEKVLIEVQGLKKHLHRFSTQYFVLKILNIE